MSSLNAKSHLADLAKISATGVANTVVGFLIIFSLMAAGIGPFISNVAGYAVGWLMAFVLYRDWVFRARKPSRGIALRYLVAIAFAFLVNLMILRMAIDAGLWPWLAQIIAGGGYTITIYLISTLWVFRTE